jgi:hypothetical protein
MAASLDEITKTKALCHIKCGTIAIPHPAKGMAAQAKLLQNLQQQW